AAYRGRAGLPGRSPGHPPGALQTRRRARARARRAAVLPVHHVLDQEAPGLRRPGPGRPPRRIRPVSPVTDNHQGATLTRVWLPDALDKFGPLPAGIEADVWDGGDDLPAGADQVEYIVVPFGVKLTPAAIGKIAALPRLKTIQILSAGAEHVLPHVPAHITLCNARGAHTPATAEWAAGAVIASLRDFPRFAVAQRDGHWDYARSESVAGKHVLIVGYGDIGAAVERRLAGWEVTVERVA